MKKLILTLILFIATLLNARCICYYFTYNSDDTPMFKKTCDYYSKVIEKTLGITCLIKPYSHYLYLPEDKKTVIIFSGHGNPKGLYLTHPDNISKDYNNGIIYNWKDLMEDVNADLVIIDACFSGYAHDYPHPNVSWLITSTYRENSWNVCDPNSSGDNIPVSALAISLRCKYDDEYQCPYNVPIFGNCPFMTINECQLKLIIDSIYEGGMISFYDWEIPSIGTCVLNNKPCSYYLH